MEDSAIWVAVAVGADAVVWGRGGGRSGWGMDHHQGGEGRSRRGEGDRGEGGFCLLEYRVVRGVPGHIIIWKTGDVYM